MCSGIKPADTPPRSDPVSRGVVVSGTDNPAERPPQSHVSRHVVFDVLTNVPPLEVSSRIRQSRSLTHITGLPVLRIDALYVIPNIGFGTSLRRAGFSLYTCGILRDAIYGLQPRFFPKDQTGCLA